jgi:UMF1 family MFS transporter
MGASSRAITAWCLYDVGNSAFATTVIAALLPVYFSEVAGASLHADPARARVLATTTWAWANTLSLAVVAVGSPLLGAVADLRGGRKRLLAGFAVIGALLTALLVTVERGDWLRAATLFAFAQVAYSWSIVMYDSLLPHVADPGQLDRVSSRGFAWGYLGGGVLLAAQVAAILKPRWFGLHDAGMATRLSFLTVGVWWLLFTLPLLRHVHERRGRTVVAGSVRALELPRRTLALLWKTLHELRGHRDAFRFLIAFWLYNDGIGTIVRMATIFGAEIGVGRTTLIGAILLVQFLGFPFSLLFGRLAARFGPKRAVLAALVGYVGICVFATFMTSALHFWLLAVLVSVVQGGAQALSRSLFAAMIPVERSAEFFGFYDLSSKFAGILGPLVFAAAGTLLGSSRFGVLAVLVFFVAGIAVLSTVHPERSAAPGGRRAEAPS